MFGKKMEKSISDVQRVIGDDVRRKLFRPTTSHGECGNDKMKQEQGGGTDSNSNGDEINEK